MSTQHDEQHFLGELMRLFDPVRIHGKDDDAFVKEVQQYYQGLDPEEQQVFEQAVLRWLRSGDRLRQRQAASLCWALRLKGCVDDLLRLGKSLHSESPSHMDLDWVIQALGKIGDAKAIDFLTEEALEESHRNGALASISQIDLEQALQLIPKVLEDYWQSEQPPVRTQSLLWCLLHGHPKKDQGKVAWWLGASLSHFPNKEHLCEQFSQASYGLDIDALTKVPQGLDYDTDGKRLVGRDKQRLMQAFREGLEQKPRQPEI